MQGRRPEEVPARHEHDELAYEIPAPIDEGEIDSSASPSVQLRVDSRKMRVLDPEISVDKRAEIQQTMEGTAVLDVAHFREISYRSTAISWAVTIGVTADESNPIFCSQTGAQSTVPSGKQSERRGESAEMRDKTREQLRAPPEK